LGLADSMMLGGEGRGRYRDSLKVSGRILALFARVEACLFHFEAEIAGRERGRTSGR
jgi:hypothetical protein